MKTLENYSVIMVYDREGDLRIEGIYESYEDAKDVELYILGRDDHTLPLVFTSVFWPKGKRKIPK